MKIGAQTPQQTMSQKARFNMYMLVESSLVRLGNKFKILRFPPQNRGYPFRKRVKGKGKGTVDINQKTTLW